jgi:hypothetical protein
MEYQMPVKAIKRILGEELSRHYTGALEKLHTDPQREFCHFAYRQFKSALDAAETRDDLQEVLSFTGYHMSVEEWINSL